MTSPLDFQVDPFTPFTIEVYRKDFHRVGWLGGYTSAEVVPRHNAIGTATFVLPLGHRRIADLMAPGARAVVRYGPNDKLVMSGKVRTRSGTGTSVEGAVSFGLRSDFELLTKILGWPNPTGSLSQQGAATAYYRVRGPAETVVKRVAQINADRLGIPLTIATDQGRGDTITVLFRMHALTDRLLPIVDDAGIGIDVHQSGAGYVLDCYLPQVRERVLSEDSGAVVGWGWDQEDRSATRTVLGGAGEGTGREFRQAVDAAAEADTNDVLEVFTDARDIGSEWEDAIEANKDAKADQVKTAAALLAARRVQTATQHRYDDASSDLADAVTKLADGPATGSVHDHLVSRRDALTDRKAAAAADLSDATKDYNEADSDNQKALTEISRTAALIVSTKAQFEADMVERGAQALADAAPTYGLSLSLAETATVRYGRTLVVGDHVRVEVAPGVIAEDVCREVTLSHTYGDGLVVTPSVGGGDTDPDKVIVRVLKSIVRHLRVKGTG